MESFSTVALDPASKRDVSARAIERVRAKAGGPDGHSSARGLAIFGRKRGWVLLVVAVATLLPFASSVPVFDPPTLMRISPHASVRMVGIALALAIFLLTWNTRRGQPVNVVLAGFGCLAAAVLGAVDMTLLPGAPDLASGPAGRISAILRLAAETAASASLLAAALGPTRPASVRTIRIGAALAVAQALLGICLAAFPPRWLEDIGLAAALVPPALAFLATGLLLRRRRRGQVTWRLLALAALLGGIGMLLGSWPHRNGTTPDIMADAYQMLAWLVAYRALFRIGVQGPRHRLIETGLAVEEERQRYRELFDTAPDGLLLVDPAGIVIEANPAAATMFGWSGGGLIGRPVEALVPRHLRANHEQARAHFMAAPRSREMGAGGSLMAQRHDGAVFPVEVALVPQEFGRRRATLCIVRDVTQRRQLEESLMRQALHDALTELPNRRHFRDSVTKSLAHAERHGSIQAVLFIDLDNFKHVNDSLGHSHGDELLRQVAQRLGQTVRAGDLLARMGGDEFALLLEGAGPEDAAAVAAKVLQALELPFRHGGQTMKVGASIGITLAPVDGRDVEELLSNADLAMYRAKEQGRNTWHFFEQRMTESLRARSALQQDLACAIERGQLSLAFQPRVRADDGSLTGFEALLRWQHPEHGNVAPDVFIRLAEESGQIVQIGEWALRESCAQAMRWRLGGGRALTMAVNVSTHQLRHAAFAVQVQQVLADTGWPAGQLELEITETALMEDPREAAVLLRRLVRLGVHLAVDDFGTGYSSLAYLKDFPLHRLKVDRSFVQGLGVASRDRVIASSIIQLAHALGLQVTAEGVETSLQREFLVQQQCDELQGYLFGVPLPPPACDVWLRTAVARPSLVAGSSAAG
jgi:diguanylate cyclase (GGDEF)-like protein/PAS domain S-box-containing protein